MKNYYIAEIEIKYLPKSIKSLKKITCSNDAYEYFTTVWSEHISYKEEIYLMCLNRSNKILGYSVISSGGVAGTVADPKLIFQAALKANASSIIIAHNHPSGNLTASSQDINLTKKILKAGKFLELPLLDHLILTNEGFYSFADEGMLEIQ